MFKIETNTKIPKDFEIIRTFLKKDYEVYLLGILNRSRLFPSDLCIIENQSNWEDDYFSKNTNKTYETTLLLSTKISKQYSLYGEEIWNRGDISEELFDSVKDDFIALLERKVKKKKIIIFNIFPFRFTQIPKVIYENNVTAPYLWNNWSILLDETIGNNIELITDKEIYLVSYNQDNTFFIQSLYPKWGMKEYIDRISTEDWFPLYSEVLNIKFL